MVALLKTILTDFAKRKAAKPEDKEDKTVEPKPAPVEPTPPVEVVCDACKAYKDKVTALRLEVKDISAEFDCAKQAHIEDVEKAKVQLADALVVLDQLSGKKIEDPEKAKTENASLSLEDLLKKSDSLQEALDMKTPSECYESIDQS